VHCSTAPCFDSLIPNIVAIVTGYTLDDRDSVPGRSKNFAFRHHIQTGSGAQPAAYRKGILGIPRVKASEA